MFTCQLKPGNFSWRNFIFIFPQISVSFLPVLLSFYSVLNMRLDLQLKFPARVIYDAFCQYISHKNKLFQIDSQKKTAGLKPMVWCTLYLNLEPWMGNWTSFDFSWMLKFWHFNNLSSNRNNAFRLLWRTKFLIKTSQLDLSCFLRLLAARKHVFSKTPLKSTFLEFAYMDTKFKLRSQLQSVFQTIKY